jgi:hypothetical protein
MSAELFLTIIGYWIVGSFGIAGTITVLRAGANLLKKSEKPFKREES